MALGGTTRRVGHPVGRLPDASPVVRGICTPSFRTLFAALQLAENG
jgi:hypothetical protein